MYEIENLCTQILILTKVNEKLCKMSLTRKKMA